MTNETRQTLRDLLGITSTSQVTPNLIQRAQTAARELLTTTESTSSSGAAVKKDKA